ncbi:MULTISPECIES: 16S rRNA (guanine(966)-N(2))-methyltransferase RsmD [Paraliobacillus]|uniref:16S rRNA (guanine(966)-N(2))-methyltransferase RsmD n=1 Tax=Paraliobacillus TaxID=200903 RepID=UPI000DD314FD|nr:MULTISPECIES: 16S rRNA (guanine(966)-N(2))-methyltransferase RsmD [Paraliobacillus]
MRVIAGTYKGRRLQSVPNNLTRPTTDKVKEALFQMIGPYFEGGMCLDLFAGSGALGIEALSRGMDKVIFVDQQSKAIQTIYANLEILDLEDHAEVFRTEAFRALKAAGKRDLTFDLVFLDPPYEKISYEKLLEALLTYKLVTDKTIIVCEHERRQSLPDYYEGFHKLKTERYSNSTAISLYKKGEEKNE